MTSKRKSNLELLRIVAMLLIIEHHYVVNSGITDFYDYSNISANMIFLQLWGAWGKTAINCFVLISGYFMCTSQLTYTRYLKIYFTAKMYKIVVFVALAVMGYQEVSVRSILQLLFCYLLGAGEGFTGSFLVFYLFIPFYNSYLNVLTKSQLKMLNTFLLFFQVIVPTFLFNEGIFEPIVWYMTLYFVAAYIRLYPEAWMKNNRLCGGGLLLTLLMSCLSIIVVDYIGTDYGFGSYYHMMGGSSKLFAFLVGMFAFLFFMNLKMENSKIINKIAATTFGVLCIHASSDAMRTFLWEDLLNVSAHYYSSFWGLVVHALLSAVGVFAVCSIIDMCKIRYIETPIFVWINSNRERIEKYVRKKTVGLRVE